VVPAPKPILSAATTKQIKIWMCSEAVKVKFATFSRATVSDKEMTPSDLLEFDLKCQVAIPNGDFAIL
tara:strand:+ start:234 stop:437 length:204 start_codon:yes stop_codon:yes gene_type:complete